MNLFRILMFAAAAGAVTLLAVYLSSYREAQRAGKRMSQVVSRLESGYLDFMRTHFSIDILSRSDYTHFSESLVSEAMPILEPHINALIASINGNSSKAASVEPPSALFANVAATAEWLNQVGSGPQNPLSPEQEQQIRSSVEVAVRADLIRRKMNLEAGNL